MARMTTADINPKYLPQIHAQFAAQNNRPVPDPKPECNEAPKLAGSVPGKEKGVGRVTVRFTGFRVQPLDPDNFAGSVKDLLDGLRHAGLIHGDEYWRIRLETDQVKVGHYADERTEIEIIQP